MVIYLPKSSIGFADLVKFYESGWGHITFDSLDRATREAIHTRIVGSAFVLNKILGDKSGTPKSLAQEVGANYLDGYAIGRLLVGTVKVRLSYSGDINDASIKCTELCAKANEIKEDDILNWAGLETHRFLAANCAMQSKLGSYADIADNGVALIQVFSANRDGLTLAVAEHLLFASKH